MFFFDDIPHKVSIVEGVEIAKIYGNSESSKFINGVLDSLYNDLKNNKIKLYNYSCQFLIKFITKVFGKKSDKDLKKINPMIRGN